MEKREQKTNKTEVIYMQYFFLFFKKTVQCFFNSTTDCKGFILLVLELTLAE